MFSRNRRTPTLYPDDFRIPTILVALAYISSGCAGSADPADECGELCDGIIECRNNNANCVAMNITAQEPFRTNCVQSCTDTVAMLSDEQKEGAVSCLDCLRATGTSGVCVGETLLDTTCMAECRTPGAIVFRDGNFLPWEEISCLKESP